jgi:hypothetical protein
LGPPLAIPGYSPLLPVHLSESEMLFMMERVMVALSEAERDQVDIILSK